MRRYILGESSEGESDRLQAAYFNDERLFNALLSVEEDLFDSYARGELSAAERARFEQRLLITRGQRQRVAFARLLMHASDMRLASGAPELPDKTSSWWRSLTTWLRDLSGAPALAFGGALVVVATGITWFAVQHRNKQSSEPAYQQQQAAPVAQSQPTSEHPVAKEGVDASPALSPEQSQQALQPKTSITAASRQESSIIPRIKSGTTAQRDTWAREGRAGQPRMMPSGVASLVLTSGLVRDGGNGAKLIITPTTRRAKLHIEVTNTDNTRYRAVVQTAEGVEVFRQFARAVRRGRTGHFVDLSVPAKLLTKRDYVVLLHDETPDGASENIGGYSFVVVRQ